MNATACLSAALLAAAASPATAAITSISNPSATSFSSLILDGQTFVPGDFIPGTLTAVQDDDAALLIPQGGTVPVDGSSVLDGFLSLNSGLANLESLTFTFDDPITETSGLNEITLFEFGSRSGGLPTRAIEDFTVTIAGTSNAFVNPMSDNFGSNGSSVTIDDLDFDLFSGGGAVSTPAALDGISYTAGPSSLLNAPINFLSFSLSDFGLLEGQSINALTITSTGLDPVSIIAVPEPATLALVAVGGLVMARRRG